MALNAKNAAIFAKRETTYGTDAVVAGTDFVAITNFEIAPFDSDFVDRDLIMPSLGIDQSILVRRSAQVSFEVEIAGAGAAGTVPKYGACLRGCALSETVATGTSVTYAPVSSGFESLTIDAYQDGVRHRMLGARGSAAFSFAAGQLPKIRFTFRGLYVSPVDATSPAISFTGWQTPLGVTDQNTPTFSLHGFAAGVLQSLALDLNNQVVHRNLVGAESVLITGRAPQGAITMDALKNSEFNFWSRMEAAQTGALQLIHGTSAGNIVDLNVLASQLINPKYSESDGIVMLNADLRATRTGSGNNEFSLVVR